MNPGFRIKLSGSQVHGAALLAFLALLIPALIFLYREYFHSAPTIPYVDEGKGFIAVEIDGNFGEGIYFLPAGKRLNDLLSILRTNPASLNGGPANPDNSIFLKDGFKVEVLRLENNQSEIRVGRMAASTRLALGRPIDVNSATLEDLVLAPGLGEKTAEKVIEERNKRGRFKQLEDLMKIKGIKQKRLEKLKPYLYVEKI